MAFCGIFEVMVDEKGEFLLPEYYNDVTEGDKYEIFCFPEEREKGLLYISYVFDQHDMYNQAESLGSGCVTADKKLKVPDKLIEVMQGECVLIGNFTALELSKVPIDMLVYGVADNKELDILFD